MKITKSILNSVRAPVNFVVDDEEKDILIETFIVASIVVMVCFSAFALVTIVDPLPMATVINSSAAFLLLINLLIYKKIKNYFYACQGLFAIGTLALFFHQISCAEPYIHNYFWACLIPVFASIMTGKKTGGVWAIVITLLFSISYIFVLQQTEVSTGIKITKNILPFHFVVALSLAMYASYILSKVVIAELEERRKKIDKAHTNNQMLLNIVTHDVANPLMVLKTALGMVKDNELNDKTVKQIERMRRSVTYLEDVIKNVRNSNAINCGKFVLDIKPFNLNSVFDRVHFLFEEALLRKQLTLEIPKEKKEVMVFADGVVLGQSVINNLISNAIKFSNIGGTIKIIIEQTGTSVTFSVIDHGIGMSEETKNRIFLPYTPTTRKGTDHEEGTGFGMPIVKALMERHGGDVFIESAEGVGTTVTLKLLPCLAI